MFTVELEVYLRNERIAEVQKWPERTLTSVSASSVFFRSSSSLRETVAKFLTHYCSSPAPLEADNVSKRKVFPLTLTEIDCL